MYDTEVSVTHSSSRSGDWNPALVLDHSYDSQFRLHQILLWNMMELLNSSAPSRKVRPIKTDIPTKSDSSIRGSKQKAISESQPKYHNWGSEVTSNKQVFHNGVYGKACHIMDCALFLFKSLIKEVLLHNTCHSPTRSPAMSLIAPSTLKLYALDASERRGVRALVRNNLNLHADVW